MDRQREHSVQLVLIAAALGVLSACAGSGQASTLPSQHVMLTEPPGPAAERYDTKIPEGTAVLDDALHTLQRSLSAASETHAVQLEPDPRLLRLATWVGQHLAPDGTLPAQAALDQATRHLGLIEPTPHVVVIATDSRDDVSARLASDIAALFAEHDYSHYGSAAIERDGLIVYVVALTFRFTELAPVPRAIPVGGSIVLSGRLTHGFTAPELAVTRPDGQVTRGNPGSGSAFEFRVSGDVAGVYRIELLAQSKLGIAVVANFPLYVGEAPDDRIELTAPEAPVSDPAEAAQRMLALINTERAKVQLAPLAFDDKLSEVAASHVADMLAAGFVGHTSPTTGTASERVTRAGVRTSLVLENIGRGYSLAEVHAGLMQSPGHRSNLLHAQATHVGIAVAVQQESGHSVYLVTELFVRVTPKLPDDAIDTLSASINRQRAQHRRSQLRDDSALAQIAQRAANHCFDAGAQSDAVVMQLVRSELARLGPRSERVSALLSLASSLTDLAQLEALLDPALGSIGVGLAQGTRPDTPPNTVCAVLLLGQ